MPLRGEAFAWHSPRILPRCGEAFFFDVFLLRTFYRYAARHLTIGIRLWHPHDIPPLRGFENSLLPLLQTYRSSGPMKLLIFLLHLLIQLSTSTFYFNFHFLVRYSLFNMKSPSGDLGAKRRPQGI